MTPDPYCPVCRNVHADGITMLIEGGHPIQDIARFYELSVEDLRSHQLTCMCSLGEE